MEYVIEKFVAAADAWSKAGAVTGTAFEVNDLELGREYAFAVRAVNAEGESDALPTAKTMVAKDAYSKCISLSSIRISSFTGLQRPRFKLHVFDRAQF